MESKMVALTWRTTKQGKQSRNVGSVKNEWKGKICYSLGFYFLFIIICTFVSSSILYFSNLFMIFFFFFFKDNKLLLFVIVVGAEGDGIVLIAIEKLIEERN